jgi:hypothetical protein
MRTGYGVIVGVLICPSSEAGQQPSTTVIERRDASGSVTPWRLTQTTTVDGDRETTTETEHVPDVEGRMQPVQEAVIETIRSGQVTRTRVDRFWIDGARQRRLLDTTESVEDASSPDRLQVIGTTRRVDVNGRISVAERVTAYTTETREGRSSERTIERTDLNGQLRPEERAERTERRVSPTAVEEVVTLLKADVNHRWQVIDSERSVRDSTTRQDGREDVVIETYAEYGFPYMDRSTVRPRLAQRIHRSITPSADGGRDVVEDVEARSLVSPEDRLRIVRRTIESVRSIGPGRWETERQIFERDPNNRLTLISTHREETSRP